MLLYGYDDGALVLTYKHESGNCVVMAMALWGLMHTTNPNMATPLLQQTMKSNLNQKMSNEADKQQSILFQIVFEFLNRKPQSLFKINYE